MKRIFLTGATGFLGSYVARLLIQKGYQVVAIRRSKSRLELLSSVKNLIEWHTSDILDIEGLDQIIEQCDAVIHAAAIVSYSPKQVKQMMLVNVQGTANIVNLSLEHRKRLVHVSSIAALGRHPSSITIDENVKWNEDETTTQYARSKYRAELEVHRGIAEGLNAVIINPSVILGAGFWNTGTAKFFKLIQQGLQYYPSGSAGFVDVRDVAKQIVFLLESNIQDQRFISNAANLTFKDLFNIIAQELNVQPPSISPTSFQKGVAWRLAMVKAFFTNSDPIITKETLVQSSINRSYSGEKIAQLSGAYRPKDVTISEVAQSFQATYPKVKFGILGF